MPIFRFILTIALTLSALPLSAVPGNVPEKLVYDLSWTGIPVGSAYQTITENRDDLIIKAAFTSNSWLSSIHPVENIIETHLSKKPGVFPGQVNSFHMRFHEGYLKRDKKITFDHKGGIASYIDNLTGEKAHSKILPGTSDVTTSFYQARHLPLTPGESISMPVIDGKEPYLLEVKILKKEKVKTIFGKVDTLVVEPMVRPEGTFEGKRGIKLWVTDDARRIPVKLQTKVTVGSVTATLVGVE